MAKQQKNYDPSKPLRNRKHEKFCQVLAKNPEANQSEAYKEVYPDIQEDTAVVNASRLLGNANVRDRVMALLTKDNAGLKDVSSVMSKHLHGDNAPVSADMCKTILKVAGALDEQKQTNASYNPVTINFIVRKADTKPIDIIDVTAQDSTA